MKIVLNYLKTLGINTPLDLIKAGFEFISGTIIFYMFCAFVYVL